MTGSKRDAMLKLLNDAGAKTVNALKEHDAGNPIEAEFKLLFAIAENTAVIASLMFEDRMERDRE